MRSWALTILNAVFPTLSIVTVKQRHACLLFVLKYPNQVLQPLNVFPLFAEFLPQFRVSEMPCPFLPHTYTLDAKIWKMSVFKYRLSFLHTWKKWSRYVFCDPISFQDVLILYFFCYQKLKIATWMIQSYYCLHLVNHTETNESKIFHDFFFIQQQFPLLPIERGGVGVFCLSFKRKRIHWTVLFTKVEHNNKKLIWKI